MLSVLSATGQDDLKNGIKTALVFNICNELKWDEYSSASKFTIGFYGHNRQMLHTLKGLQSKQIHKRTVKIVHFTELEDIVKTDVLFLDVASNDQIERVFKLLRRTNTLLFTDQNSYKRMVMINFYYDEANQTKFEINSRNIEDEHIKMNPSIILLGGTELDVRDLYLETEKELDSERKKVTEIEEELSVKQTELNNLTESLIDIRNQVEQKNADIQNLSDSISLREVTLQDQEKFIVAQQGLISKQNDSIKSTKNSFQLLTNDIALLQNTYSEQLESNAQTKAEKEELDRIILINQKNIDKQEKQLQEQEDVIDTQQRIMYLMLVVGALLLLSISLAIVAYRQKKRMNVELDKLVKQRTLELDQKNKDLQGEIETRKEYANKLEKSESSYREIYNSSTDAIFIHDLNGKIVDVNKSMLEMYGYNKEEVFDLSIGELSAEKDGYTSELAGAYVGKAIVEGNLSFDWKARTKDGTDFWVEVVLRKTILYDQERIIAVVRDINEKKIAQLALEQYQTQLEQMVEERTYQIKEMNEELETSNEELQAFNEELNEKNEIIQDQNHELKQTLQTLKETQSQLLQSEKMASLGILTAGVAHEINNPLNYIMGAYTGLNRHYEEKTFSDNYEEVGLLIAALKTGVDRSSAIVQGLNQFSRKSESHDEDCYLHSIIDNSLTMLHNKIKHHITIDKDFTDSDVIVKGNVGNLHQVFINVLGNAVQAIESDGIIKIKTSIYESTVMIVVTDTGGGIAPGNLNKVTDPFFTTKDPGEGTGMGLSISYNIIQEHNGALMIDSELGVGTSVKISFPLYITEGVSN